MDSKREYRDSLKVNIEEMQITERQKRRVYEQFVSGQEPQFLLLINYLNKYINELRNEGTISPYLEFRARIKATNSALKNNEQKALDDIFGIEVICATDEEINVIQQKLESMLTICKQKIHNKDNGYKAIHDSCIMNEELTKKLNEIGKRRGEGEKNSVDFPMVEIQYKTIAVFYEATYGKASHEAYKGVELERLQSLYDSNSLTVGEYIPCMWISDPNSDEVRELSTEEVLKKMYPSLKLNKEKVEDGR